MIIYSNFKADSESRVEVFDLRTGQLVPSLGGQQPTNCGGPPMDQLQLNDQGITAVHAAGNGAEQIIASDHTGLHVLDTAQSTSAIPALTHLTLTADTLTWEHDGQPESATLS